MFEAERKVHERKEEEAARRAAEVADKAAKLSERLAVAKVGREEVAAKKVKVQLSKFEEVN
jgi:hypothetical protein